MPKNCMAIPNSVSWPGWKKKGIITAIRKTTDLNLLYWDKCKTDVWFYWGKIAESDHYV